MNASLKGKLCLEGHLELLSPLLIGTGKRESDVDICIIRDDLGNPFIPATSIAGVLRHRYDEKITSFGGGKKEDYDMQKRYFWGGCYTDSDKTQKSSQSALIIDDTILLKDAKYETRVRDGVGINPKTGTAEPEKKYDYEILEPGAVFQFICEVTVRKEFDKDYFLAVLGWIAHEMTSPDFALGAMTGKGFGRIKLNDWKIYDYDFADKRNVMAWLISDNSVEIYDQLNPVSLEDFTTEEKSLFSIQAVFKVNTSLIVKDYTGDPHGPDAVHITSKNRPVLPGTSVRGALRARSERIVRVLDAQNDDLIKQLFGWVDDQKNTVKSDAESAQMQKKKEGKSPVKAAHRGKITVEETEINMNTMVAEIQKRIRIDRFTGGVMSGALFDSMPLWPEDETHNHLEIRIAIKDYEDWEAGLMLLVLKDLWTGDLPLGGEKNIGRGTLYGQRATIVMGDETIILEERDGRLILRQENSGSDWDERIESKLEAMVTALQTKIMETRKAGREVVNHA